MNVLAWILSGLLGLMYLAAGVMKATQPREKLLKQENFGWMNDYTAGGVKAIGTVEALGGLGLVLPWWTGIAQVLTPVAAVGLAIVQVGAMRVHVRRGETKALPMNAVLLILALVIAAIRFVEL